MSRLRNRSHNRCRNFCRKERGRKSQPSEHHFSLTELALGYNSISDISALSGLTNLSDLSLDGNSISDLSPLAGLVNLKYLSLEGNAISDLSPLKSLTNLQDLYIKNNSGLTPEAVRELQQALPNCRISTDLDLSIPEETPVVSEDPFVEDGGKATAPPEESAEAESSPDAEAPLE